jgi:hypothetical protein
MSRRISTHGELEVRTKLWLEKLKGSDCFGDLTLNGK